MVPENHFEKRDRIYGRISFWISLILTTGLTCWYYQANPPDDEATKKTRLFIAENAIDVSKFLRLPYEEQNEFAAKSKHSFYKDFVRASEVKKIEIRALVHNSIDYKPTQYWVNLAFLWGIFFTAFWFLGLMTQAMIQLTRRGKKSGPNASGQ
ncbi:MAG: hypothetical protein ACE5GQ_12465 [Nitrospinales bacterium]